MRPDLMRLFSRTLREMSVEQYLKTCFATYTPPRRIVYPGAIREEKPPASVATALPWKFSSLLKRRVPEAFVLLLHQAVVCGGNGAIITSERILLRDLSREFGHRHLHSLQRRFRLPVPEKRDAVVGVLTTAGGGTYYHWLFDIIPRIHLIREAGLFDAVDFFVLPPVTTAYQRELLGAAGIAPDKWIIAGDLGFCLEARELVVPSLPADLGTVTDWAVAYIRDLFLPPVTAPSGPRKRLYLTRRSAGNRKMQDEESLLLLLSKYGFDIIEPEKLSLAAQAALFRDAELVMGPHGSGFGNLVFCRPATKVIELFSSGFGVPCFWILANLNDLEYHFAFDSGNDAFPLRPYWEGQPEDLRFSVDRMEQILRTAGVRPQSSLA